MPLCDSGYYDKLMCNDDNFIDSIRVITSKLVNIPYIGNHLRKKNFAITFIDIVHEKIFAGSPILCLPDS